MRRAGAATRSGARQVLHHKSRKRNAGEPRSPLPAFFAESRANKSAFPPGKAARQGDWPPRFVPALARRKSGFDRAPHRMERAERERLSSKARAAFRRRRAGARNPANRR